jgi:hypothetical protein
MSQQGLRQASIRAVTGTSETYNGDWHALFDLAGIPAGEFNGRMLSWVNGKLGTSHTSLSSALQALAVANGAYNFSSMGTFDAGGSGPTPTPPADIANAQWSWHIENPDVVVGDLLFSSAAITTGAGPVRTLIYDMPTSTDVSTTTQYSVTADDHDDVALLTLASGKVFALGTGHNHVDVMWSNMWSAGSGWAFPSGSNIEFDDTVAGGPLTYSQPFQGASGKIYMPYRVNNTSWYWRTKADENTAPVARTQIATGFGAQGYMAWRYSSAIDKALAPGWRQPDTSGSNELAFMLLNCATDVFTGMKTNATADTAPTTKTPPQDYSNLAAAIRLPRKDVAFTTPAMTLRVMDISNDLQTIDIYAYQYALLSTTALFQRWRYTGSDGIGGTDYFLRWGWTPENIADGGAPFDTDPSNQTYNAGMIQNNAGTANYDDFFICLPSVAGGQTDRLEHWVRATSVSPWVRTLLATCTAPDRIIRPISPQGATATTPIKYLTMQGYASGFNMANAVAHYVLPSSGTLIDYPVIGTAANILNPEGTQLAEVLTATGGTGPYTWTISPACTDAAKFELNTVGATTTLRWASNGVKDFDAPDNLYAATWEANQYGLRLCCTDATGASSWLDVTVTVGTAQGGAAFVWTDLGTGYKDQWDAADWAGVGTWNSKVNAIALTASGSPTYLATGFNSLPCVQFDGATQKFRGTTNIAALAGSTNEEVLCMMEPDVTGPAANMVAFAMGSTSGTSARQISYDNTVALPKQKGASVLSNAALRDSEGGGAAVAMGTYLAATATTTYGGRDGRGFLPTFMATQSSVAMGTTAACIGNNNNTSSTVWFKGKVRKVYCLAGLSWPNRQRAMGLAYAESNLQSLLPAAHPFRTFAPRP